MSLPEFTLRSRIAALTTHRVARFVVVGSINTAVDLIVYSVLVLATVAVVPANLISSSVGLTVSYFLNRSFVFAATADLHWLSRVRQIGLFLLTTGFGLWVLQPLVILGVGSLIGPLTLPLLVRIAGPKLVATCVTLVWNYTLYSVLVFARRAPRAR